jgi:hypothetical protein
MKVVAYVGKGSPEGRRLEETIREAAKPGKVALCRTLKTFREELQFSQTMGGVVVLLGTSRRVLLNLLSFQEHFDRFQLIVIVPDAEEKTLAQAHRLKPRYVTLTGGDFVDVGVVLGRLLKRAETMPRSRWPRREMEKG